MGRGMSSIIFAAVLLLATGAQADSDNWYFQGLVGKRFLTEADLTLNGGTSDVTISVDAVPSGSAAVGYRFQSFPHRSVDMRVEVQGGASESEPDTITPRGELATRAGTTAKLDGFDANNLHSIYGMLNFWFDYRLSKSWVATAGVGLGAAYIRWDNANCCGLGTILDDNALTFAYQVGGSIGYEILKDLVIGIDYRYFRTVDPEFEFNGDWSSEYGAHDLMFAFRYYVF